MHVITSLGPGGAERQVEHLATHSGGRVTVICLYFGGLVGDAIASKGVPVLLLGMRGPAKLTASLRLAILLRRLAPDVVNVHLLAAQLWGIPAARLAGVPVIVSTEHSLMDDSIEGRPHRRWLQAVYRGLERMTDHTVAVSAATSTRLQRWGVRRERISVIHNAVDFEGAAFKPQRRAPARLALGLPQHGLVFASVGRLEAVKRLAVLIDAAAEVLPALDAHLVVIGEGTMRAALEERAARASIGARTVFAGPRPDVTDLLNAFDVFVSPSQDETFGIAIVEAVANGLPVIYGQCPALEGTDPSSFTGRTIERGPCESTRLRAAMAAMARAARRPAPAGLRASFEPCAVAASYDALYTTLAASRSRRRLSGDQRGWRPSFGDTVRR